jgi:hypothetical protein
MQLSTEISGRLIDKVRKSDNKGQELAVIQLNATLIVADLERGVEKRL